MKFNPRVLQIAEYPSADLAARKCQMIREAKTIFDFSLGDPIEATPRFIRNALREGVPEVSQYPTIKGIPELRNAIAGYLKRRFDTELDPESEILPCLGSREAIYNTPFLFIGQGNNKDTVIAPVPGYLVMEKGAVIAGARYYPVELGEETNYHLRLQDLHKDVLERAAIVWLNYPHNPSGVQCSLQYLQEQVEIAKRYEIVLCSDECYVDQYYGTEQPPSVLQITNKGVLAFHSCSKRSGMTTYRSGFVAGDAQILKLYSNFRNSIGTHSPIYNQYAATAALSDYAHAAERREIFRAKREVLLSFFQETGFHVISGEATIYLWVQTPEGQSGKEYAEFLLQHGIMVSPGEFFGPHCKNYFRVAFVPTHEECKRAVELWRKLV